MFYFACTYEEDAYYGKREWRTLEHPVSNRLFFGFHSFLIGLDLDELLLNKSTITNYSPLKLSLHSYSFACPIDVFLKRILDCADQGAQVRVPIRLSIN